MTKNLFILTGAMGSGKSTLSQQLETDGLRIIHEPARQILAEQRSFSGRGVPETDPQLFTDLMLSRSIYLYNLNLGTKDPVIFDRGIPDMIAYASLFNLDLESYKRAAEVYRYNQTVFIMADWEEIYTTDDERKMTYEQAKNFGHALRDIYKECGYTLVEVPKLSVKDRADFILSKMQKLNWAETKV